MAARVLHRPVRFGDSMASLLDQVIDVAHKAIPAVLSCAVIAALPAHAKPLDDVAGGYYGSATTLKEVEDDPLPKFRHCLAIAFGMMKMQRGGPRVIEINVSGGSINIFTAVGSPTDVVLVFVTVLAGGCYGSPGLTTGGGWTTGSAVSIISNGTVGGAGGNGGAGGAYNANGTAGAPGGDALNLTINVDYDNTNGYVFGGGGGGGGGGGAYINISFPYYAGGGGGGGGGGAGTGGSGGAGGTGNVNGTVGNYGDGAGNPGSGGAGGNDTGIAIGGNGAYGKTYGKTGGIGGSGNTSPTRTGGAGGVAGYAVRLNGFTINWLGGNNSTQVKGPQA